MFPQRYFAPIPAPAELDWGSVPVPAECGEALTDPTALSPRITYAASYHKQGLHGMTECLLRETVARKLAETADRLPNGYSLLIFDALRPLSVQKAIYDSFRARFLAEEPYLTEAELEAKLDDFVAKPVKRLHRPAPHATGGAVDLTLCRNGVPLDMGTDFDDLTSRARTDALEHSLSPADKEARQNRRILYHLMTEAGLVNYDCEWWHYAYGERQWAATLHKTPFYGFLDRCDDLEK